MRSLLKVHLEAHYSPVKYVHPLDDSETARELGMKFCKVLVQVGYRQIVLLNTLRSIVTENWLRKIVSGDPQVTKSGS